MPGTAWNNPAKATAGGGAVVHHYLDHRTGKHKRQTLSQEEMSGRYIATFRRAI